MSKKKKKASGNSGISYIIGFKMQSEVVDAEPDRFRLMQELKIGENEKGKKL